MAQFWRFPAQPLPIAAGVAVTAAALTGSGLAKLPQVPASLLVEGSRLSVRATFEVTSTSATPTVVVSLYGGAVNSAIASKVLIAASPALVINVAATAWPGIFTYDGTFRSLGGSAGGGAAAGTINGQGTVKSGFSASGGLSAQLQEFPLPITAALRTVSTLVLDQNLELDIGITLSSTTGTPSILVTNLWADVSG